MNESGPWILAFFAAMATPIVAIITFLGSRRKQGADVIGVSAGVVKTAAEAESISVNTLAEVIEHLREDAASLRDEVAGLRIENQRLRRTVSALQTEVNELRAAAGRTSIGDDERDSVY
jgi:chromosome segregation ATPase